MEQLLKKMQGFLNMETEIPFEEFTVYYQDVIKLLQTDFQDMDKPELLKMAGITQILGLNGLDRSKRKDANSKKFKKMAEKSQFWFDAISFKANKEHGMSKAQLESAISNIFEEDAQPTA